MLKKGNVIEIEIEKIVFGGEGLGKYNDFAIFVPMSVPGDILKVEIISLKKSYGRALIKKIIKPSEDRINDLTKISYEDFCGCDFGMINYDKQLYYKNLIVNDQLNRLGKTSDYKFNPIIGAENNKNYRNKIIEPVSKKNGKIITGFYKRKSHDVVESSENYLQSDIARSILKIVKERFNKEKLSVYNEHKHFGLLRHIMIRNNSFNEAMLVIVINGNVDNKLKMILNDLGNEIESVKSIYISINKKVTNFALGRENILIYGEKFIKEELFGIKFNISPSSFFQINIEQTKKLYKLGIDYLDLKNEKTVVDAYSGTGTIGMLLSQSAKKVISIELVESATLDAIKTANENSITNIEFINGKVEEQLIKILDKGEKIDSIIFDPPRKGIAENVLHAVAKAKIEKMVYISCNLATFARDVEILEKLGYKLVEVTPVDMFPQTNHIEMVGKIIKLGAEKND